MSYTIRPAQDTDIVRLVEMSARFQDDSIYAQLFGPAQRPKLEVLVRVCLKQGTIFVGEGEDQRLVAFIALCVAEHLMNGEVYTEELGWWVEPEARGGPLAHRLRSCAEEWVRTYGGGVLKMVAPAGGRLGPYYQRLGYTAVETAYLKRLR